MSGVFIVGENELVVSNVRFTNLLKWSEASVESVNCGAKQKHLGKMRSLAADVFIPYRSIDFNKYFSADELVFWSKVFYQLGYDIFDGKVGNHENREWQPDAIADAICLSRLLKQTTI